MKKYWLVIYCLFILVSIGCKEKSPNEIIKLLNGKILKKEKFSNGKIKIESEYLKNSSGKYILDGIYRKYYEDGNLKSIVFYKNGVQDSVSMSYFPNGITSDSLYTLHGMRYGLQYQFYNNGKPRLVAYSINDSVLLCEVSYDSNASIRNINGQLLKVDLEDESIDKMDIHTAHKFINEIVLLNNTKAYLRVIVTDENNKKVSDTSMYKFVDVYQTFLSGYRHTFDKPGLYKYKAKLTLTDKTTNALVASDSVESNLRVVR